jgi:metal-dependent HD superfamily phosphatase/phosphodiesterase
MMKSPKQRGLEEKIVRRLAGLSLKTAELLIRDAEIQHLQDYANTVSIKRLHYNDHGPVHMRKVTLNSLLILDMLRQAGVRLSLEREEIGSCEDSRVAVLIAAFLHDIGLTVGRENHEQTGVLLAMPIIARLLEDVYNADAGKKIILRSLITEGIMGHMGTQKIHSLEAGVILIADGCDMEQGRARIPMLMETASRAGDIHKYSSAAVEKVEIGKGRTQPVRITVSMRESVGFFQVEEVLLPKIESSPVKPFIELYAGVEGQKTKRYL